MNVTPILCVNRKTVDLVFCSNYCDRSPLPRLFFPIITLVQMESQKNKNSKKPYTCIYYAIPSWWFYPVQKIKESTVHSFMSSSNLQLKSRLFFLSLIRMPILIRYLFPEIFLTSQKSFGYVLFPICLEQFWTSQKNLEMDQKAIIQSSSK